MELNVFMYGVSDSNLIDFLIGNISEKVLGRIYAQRCEMVSDQEVHELMLLPRDDTFSLTLCTSLGSHDVQIIQYAQPKYTGIYDGNASSEETRKTIVGSLLTFTSDDIEQLTWYLRQLDIYMNCNPTGLLASTTWRTIANVYTKYGSTPAWVWFANPYIFSC